MPRFRLRHFPSSALDRDWLFTLALVAIAIVPRLLASLAWGREPIWDGHYYHFGAVRIASGLGYSEDVLRNGVLTWKPWCHYPVGYSGFLGALYALVGPVLWLAPAANALLGSATAGLVHRVGLRFLTTTRARIAGGLVALHPGLILFSPATMSELLASFLLFLALFFGLDAQRRKGSWVASGVALGLGALVRPPTLLAAAAIGLAEQRRWLVRSLVVSAVALATILPWTIRNCRTMDGCALVSTNGGWNLAIGTLTDTGRFQTLRAADGCPVVTGQVQQDRCWASVARRRIAADPASWLRKIPAKLRETFNHQSFAVAYLEHAAPDSWPSGRVNATRDALTWLQRWLLVAAALSLFTRGSLRPQGWVVSLAQWSGLAALAAFTWFAYGHDEHPFWLLPALLPLVALIPLPGRPRRGPSEVALLWLLASTTLTHLVFFGEDRYHIVVLPALCLLAAAALRPSDRWA